MDTDLFLQLPQQLRQRSSMCDSWKHALRQPIERLAVTLAWQQVKLPVPASDF